MEHSQSLRGGAVKTAKADLQGIDADINDFCRDDVKKPLSLDFWCKSKHWTSQKTLAQLALEHQMMAQKMEKK